MSKNFWDQRYSETKFAYGTEPNQFLKQQLESLKPGKALFLGEGEGRNSVHAAKLGWLVDAIDFSDSAKEKALLLAGSNNVNINYEVCDLENYSLNKSCYDLIVLIFVHLNEELRNKIFTSSSNALKPNGRLLVEVFSKNQINNSSGGPKSSDLLYSTDDFSVLKQNYATELFESIKVDLKEGEFHKGQADVIRFVGIKL